MSDASDNARTVCEQIVLETHDLYMQVVRPRLAALAEAEDRAELGPAGYDPLFGPPLVGAEVFFIGFQPGGGPAEDSTERPGASRPLWPEQCVYATADWKLARILQSIFSKDSLLKCTGSERQFYRAANDQVYANWPKDLRSETEQFSLVKLEHIIRALKPKRIVFIGKRVMAEMMPTYEVVNQNARGHFRLGKGSAFGIPAMGCAHLSGARLTAEEMSIIRSGLNRFVAE